MNTFFKPSALAAALLLGGAGLPLASAHAQAALNPPSARISDQAIQRDHAVYEGLQGRIKALNDKGRPVRDYHLAKAQCWLDVSFHEYTRNDRSRFPQAAMNESEKLIVGMESNATLGTDTGWPLACSTSSACMRPWGPLPRRPSRATPSWEASLRARGVATTRPLPAWAGGAATAPAARAGAVSGAAAAATGVGAAGACAAGGTEAGTGVVAGLGGAAGGTVAAGEAAGALAATAAISSWVSTIRPMVSPTAVVPPAGINTVARKPS